MKNFKNARPLAKKKGFISYLVVGIVLLGLLIAGIVMTAQGVFDGILAAVYFVFLLYYAYSFLSAFFKYRKLPATLILTDEKTLYFFYTDDWKSLSFADIEKVTTEMSLPAKSGTPLSANNLFLCTKEKVVYPLACVENPQAVKQELERMIQLNR